MKIRHIKTGEIGQSSQFNTFALCEILVCFSDWMDTDYIHDYEVFIEACQEWMSFERAFQDKFLITDNYNTIFHEPRNTEDRERGYSL